MLRRQCWLFAIGSSLFAIATAPGFAMVGGAGATNLLCFIGSWFFTSAALIQLLLSRPSKSRSWETPSKRAECLSAATQFVGTLRFNVSTGAALWAHRILARRHFVWWPDAAGSVAFLISGALGVVAVTLTVGPAQLKSREWLAAWINLIGSVAFGASAVGAFITKQGHRRRSAGQRRYLRRGAVLPDRRCPHAAEKVLTSTRPSVNRPAQSRRRADVPAPAAVQAGYGSITDTVSLTPLVT